MLRVRWIERTDNGAGLPGAVLPNQELWTVRQAESDTVSRPNADIDQGRPKRVAQPLQLGAAHDAALEDQDRVIGTGPRGVAEVVQQRTFRIRLERRRDAGVIVRQPWPRSTHDDPPR